MEIFRQIQQQYELTRVKITYDMIYVLKRWGQNGETKKHIPMYCRVAPTRNADFCMILNYASIAVSHPHACAVYIRTREQYRLPGAKITSDIDWKDMDRIDRQADTNSNPGKQ